VLVVATTTKQEGSAMVWNADEVSLVTKAEAKSKIIGMAKEQGIKGAFKVFHKDTLMATPEDLPAMVDMADIRVSAVLDQA
jgi:hypothetical protein